ncbi:uncharacterized protein LOC124411290 [Diprion similis]|uniref:uncharacterized protein LOC124411290 n=1 Tax=Diprion similis TaxID=362088 RepID=UPI001EF951F7|nr:uncharacterized protein LOC124411290 [Diprion similis]XP_046746306.1 uncharacterized protein LOC124411290 [Diprion similis]
MAGIFPTDREAEASEVLYTLLSVERIKDAGTSIEETSKTEDNASSSTVQKKQHRIVKKSSNALKKSNSKSQKHLGKTSEEPPFASENEDADEITNSNADESLVVNGSEQERELTCEETEQHRKTIPKKKCGTKRKQKRVKSEGEASFEPTRLEDNAVQVLERFKRGCECQDDQCFRGLNPESVYRHRLNIAELTKAEHDMYLMGVTMACLTNPSLTARHTERRRLRAQYVYQGRRVCLDAFLYLENCTHYQIKRIRKHLVTHGVTPRVHGNHGKVPHNTFSLDIYKIATEFLKSFISKQEAKQKTSTKQGSLHLASDMTRKTVHDLYSKYCRKLSPSIKIMGYSTFRRFMKVQFPQVKFAKVEFVVKGQVGQNQNSAKGGAEERDNKDKSAGKKDLVPLVIANSTVEQNGAYLLTPVNKLQEGVSYQLTSDGFLVKSSTAQFTVVNNRCPE